MSGANLYYQNAWFQICIANVMFAQNLYCKSVWHKFATSKWAA